MDRIIKKAGKFTFEFYFGLQVLLAFTLMLNLKFYLGGMIGLFLACYSFLNIKSKDNTVFRNLIWIYIFFLLMTIVGYSSNGKPVSLFLLGITGTILPIFVFFIGNNSRTIHSQFYNITLYILFIFYLCSLYLYFTEPAWYINWKLKTLSESAYWTARDAEWYIMEQKSLTGFFSHSYFVGYTAFSALCIILSLIAKKGFTIVYFLIYLVVILTLLFAQQRIAIALGGLVLIFYHIYIIKFSKNKRVKLFFIIEIILFFILFFIIAGDSIDTIITMISRRFEIDALGERDYTWYALQASQQNFITGHGLNSAGHDALNLGYLAVSDGEFFKMLYEGGVVSLVLFFMIMILTIIRGLKNYKYFSVELPIICFYLVAIIGANPFSHPPLMVVICWFCVGRIWNKPYLEKLKINADHI